MRYEKLFICLISALWIFTTAVRALPVSVSNLYQYADALNIEGGIIPSQKKFPNQIWANLAIVLDRPTITGETLDAISNKNNYKLKEASILEYDEHKVNLAYSAVLDYYINNTRRLSKKNNVQIPKLVIYIHRLSSAPAHLNLIEKLLSPYIKSQALVKLPACNPNPNYLSSYFYKKNDILVEFRKGYQGKYLSQDRKTDVILSLSLAAGLNPNLSSGSLLVPEYFIPYKVQNSDVKINKKYHIDNHLKKALINVINNHSEALKNKLRHVVSENKQKINFTNEILKLSDFHNVTLLEADGMFYPNS